MATRPHHAPISSSPTSPASATPRSPDPQGALELPERVPWAELGPAFLQRWGRPHGKVEPEHLEILGPTGSGKSFFEVTVLKGRAALRDSHIVVVATKPADDTVAALGWPVIDHWPPNEWKKENRQVVFWPRASDPGEAGEQQQRAAIDDLLHQLWKKQSNIVLAFDEIAYIESDLGLRSIVTRYWREARALGITIVASTQRPAFVARYMHSESTWAVFFPPKDEDDLKRMAEVAGNRNYFRAVLADLDSTLREFLLINTRTREAYISHIDDAPLSVPPKTTENREKVDRSV